MAPYQAEQHAEEEYDVYSGPQGLRVLSVGVPSDPGTPVFMVMLNGGGQVGDFLKLSFMLKRRNSSKTKEREKKVSFLSLVTTVQFTLFSRAVIYLLRKRIWRR